MAKTKKPRRSNEGDTSGIPRKLRGWVLSIDEASNQCGVSLWNDDLFRGSAVLKSNSYKDTMSVRLQTQLPQLYDFLNGYLGKGEKIHTVVVEGVRARLVLISIGAYLTCPLIDAPLTPKSSFVEASQWKKWIRQMGCKDKDPKGISALAVYGWDFDKHPVETDDEADSIMIYLTWRERSW